MGIFGNGLVQSSGGRPYVVNCYTTGGAHTWCKCTGAKMVGVITIGGGGGGGGAANFFTSGCPTFSAAGAGAGGGGGISTCLAPAACVASPAVVCVGGGGLRGYSGCAGAASYFSGGVCVCGGGGGGGQCNTSIGIPNFPAGGAGGAGTLPGNKGGNGSGGVGLNACAEEGRTRGGGGGGGVRYCAIIPATCENFAHGQTSPASLLEVPWLPAPISLDNFGRGGEAGDASLNCERGILGADGQQGMVYVVQYF
jgi:hypothetical protein